MSPTAADRVVVVAVTAAGARPGPLRIDGALSSLGRWVIISAMIRPDTAVRTWTSGSLPGITTFDGGSYNAVSDPAVAFDPKADVWLISGLPIIIIITTTTNGVVGAAPHHGNVHRRRETWRTIQTSSTGLGGQPVVQAGGTVIVAYLSRPGVLGINDFAGSVEISAAREALDRWHLRR